MVKRIKSIEETACECLPHDEAPCSEASSCENYHSFYECNPELCGAVDMCLNQRFIKNQNRNQNNRFEVRLTRNKGWGLFSLENVPSGSLIVEYIGEVIDRKEFKLRFNQMKQKNEEHYYFFSIGQNSFIDSILYGNESRFINHSCSPNSQSIKWIVEGLPRIGIFSTKAISINDEITFDYKWNSKLVCSYDSSNCRGLV